MKECQYHGIPTCAVDRPGRQLLYVWFTADSVDSTGKTLGITDPWSNANRKHNVLQGKCTGILIFCMQKLEITNNKDADQTARMLAFVVCTSTKLTRLICQAFDSSIRQPESFRHD